METVELGDEVVDTVTGFKGIAIGRTTWLHQCVRITVQPPVVKDGKYPDAMSFDEPSLRVTKRAKVKRPVEAPTRGGPAKVCRDR